MSDWPPLVANFCCELALNYCVRYSTLDGCDRGLNTRVPIDGCRGIELQRGDIDPALDGMKAAGAAILKSSEL